MALLALALALAASHAAASSGGVGLSSGSGGSGTGGKADGAKAGGANVSPPKYSRIWKRTSGPDKRWARATSECESGRNPDAIGYNGRYRGAFQFSRPTWRTSPKSPGGDPIDYSYKTQAVVAVALRHRDGEGHWPVCG